LDQVLGTVLGRLGIVAPLTTPAGVEVAQRTKGAQEFIFVLNHHLEQQEISLPEPMRDLLTGQVYEHRLALAGRGVAILVAQST
jgi:beta-galactosidase GanA